MNLNRDIYSIFSCIDAASGSMAGFRELPKVWPGTHQAVHRDDEPMIQIIRPELEKGPWIAGGAALSWYNGEAVGKADIDIFCNSRRQSESVINRIKEYKNVTEKMVTENAVTLELTDHDSFVHAWNLQVITRDFYPNVDSLLESFDINVCRVATDGETFYIPDGIASDIKHRRLVVTRISDGVFGRVTKYIAYGYEIDPMDYDDLITNITTENGTLLLGDPNGYT